MASFQSICEQLDHRRERKLAERHYGDEPRYEYELDRNEVEAIEAFRRGLYTRGTRSPKKTFWAEFEQLARASGPGLAKLLDVDYAQVKKWAQRIEHFRDKVERLDAHENGLRRPEMIPTGNQLPGLGSMTKTAPL